MKSPGQVQVRLQGTALPRPVPRTARRGRTLLVAVCCVTACPGLLLLVSDSGSVNTESPETAFVLPKENMAQGSGPDVRIPGNSLAHSGADEVSRSYFATRQKPDNPADPGVTAIDEVVQRAGRRGSSFERFEAIITLGESRAAIAELVLVDLLFDQDPEIREAAVESLGSTGTLGASHGLGYALTDANQLVRRTAIELLAEIGTRDALAALAITLNDPDVELRLAAVYELADNESVAASALLQRFLSDTDPLVTEVAAKFLND